MASLFIGSGRWQGTPRLEARGDKVIMAVTPHQRTGTVGSSPASMPAVEVKRSPAVSVGIWTFL